MMTKAHGAKVWHKKHQPHGIVSCGFTGLDKDATSSYSKADGWIYGPGSVAIVSHHLPVPGVFQWMPTSASEANRPERGIIAFQGLATVAGRDSKADDEKL